MFSGGTDNSSNPFGRDSESKSVRRVLARIFRERELLIRSDGEVRFLRISTSMQMAVVAGLVGSAIWAATAIPVTITQALTISTNETQIFEAKLAYADLLDEVTEYQATVDTVTSALSESRSQLEKQVAEARDMERQLAGAGDAQAGPRAAVARSRGVLQGHLDQVNGSLASIANDGEELESILANIRSDLAANDDGRQLVAGARARLKERADGLEMRLAEVVDKNLKVEENNAALSTNVQVTAAERDGLLKKRDELDSIILSLETRLAEVVNKNQMVEEKNAALSNNVAATTAERDSLLKQRKQLGGTILSLETQLADVTDKKLKVEEKYASLSQSLEDTAAERDGLMNEREKLRGTVQSLETNVAALSDARRELEVRRDDLVAALAAMQADKDSISEDRLSLQEQVAALDSELLLTQSKQDDIESDLAGVARSLQSVTGDTTVLADASHSLRSQIDGFLADLTSQQAIEEAVLLRATERSAGSNDEIEKIVAMSGLNVDKLLSRIESDGIGQGGPFIAASTDGPGTEELDETMILLDNNMTRWEALKEVLRFMPLSLPVDSYRMTSRYGRRTDPVNKKRSFHNGLDMAGVMNTSVYAPAPGTVIYSGPKGRYGNVVEVDHGFGLVTRYAHLNKNLVEVGDVVGHRQRIALLGNSGRSTGPHLHYEVRFDGRPMDPMKFIKAGRYVFKN
jgi:murein DD-endopeptidase MepM/ murein hydrolase activator NlpD